MHMQVRVAFDLVIMKGCVIGVCQASGPSVCKYTSPKLAQLYKESARENFPIQRLNKNIPGALINEGTNN